MMVDPASLPERDSYRLMISAFVPRPIAFVSTRSLAGTDNCAPFSYSMGVSSRPMVLAISVFEEAGLTPIPSDAVLPPRVAESPVNFECRLIRAVTVADNTVFFGEAVRLHVDDAVMTQGLVDVHKTKPIGRLGGTQYCRTQDVFELRRPRITGPKAAGPTDAR